MEAGISSKLRILTKYKGSCNFWRLSTTSRFAKSCQTTMTSGFKACRRLYLSALASPIRSISLAASGSSEPCTVATIRSPAPAENNSSVAPGAKLTILRAGAGSVREPPISSVTTCSAFALGAKPTAPIPNRVIQIATAGSEGFLLHTSQPV